MTRYAFLSTFPPTRCGLATFTDALARAIARNPGDAARIVRVLDRDEPGLRDADRDHAAIVAHLVPGDGRSMQRSIAALNAADVAIVQHEYGIFGGPDGDEVVRVMQGLRIPSVVVLHTVLPEPTVHQRAVLEAVCAHAGAVVVMTENARTLLLRVHRIDPSSVHVIPHGVPASARRTSARTGTRSQRILTWGLISPGKGLDWGIRALAGLRESCPEAEYVIAGQTHPKVLAASGESYRRSLEQLTLRLGLEDRVTFIDRYLDARSLEQLVESAAVVLLPYDSADQATSGVLAEAVSARVPVVATGFPHAVELLSQGGGVIARHKDPVSMAEALRAVLQSESADASLQPGIRQPDPRSWPLVAERYRRLADALVSERAA